MQPAREGDGSLTAVEMSWPFHGNSGVQAQDIFGQMNQRAVLCLAFTGDSGRPAIFAFDGAPDFERSNLAH